MNAGSGVFFRLFVMAAVLAFTATASFGAQYIDGEITAANPTFDRPYEDDASCSLSGEVVGYNVHQYVHTGGTVGFTVLAAASGVGTLEDPFLLVYDTSFNPASPCTDFALVNDDAIELTGPGD